MQKPGRFASRAFSCVDVGRVPPATQEMTPVDSAFALPLV